MEEEHEDHGHSVAAWTLVAIVLVGAVVGGIAVVWPSWVLGVVAVVIVILGLVAGKVLSLAGYGSKTHLAPPVAGGAPEGSGTAVDGVS